jgi:hypothetical protein
MAGLVEDEELPQIAPLHRWRLLAHAAAKFAPPIISIGCAIATGYFTYTAAHAKLPADISTLAVSILKSADAPPEMRAWAAGAVGIATDIPMTMGSIKPMPQ